MRSAAYRRGRRAQGLASGDLCSCSLHHLISGRTAMARYPHSACLRRGSYEDETHLRNSLLLALGACPNSRCSILSESDSTLGYEQVFSPLEYRSDTASAAECAGLRTEGPCFAVYC